MVTTCESAWVHACHLMLPNAAQLNHCRLTHVEDMDSAAMLGLWRVMCMLVFVRTRSQQTSTEPS